MNKHKIAFIIATNNALYYDECVIYLNKLIIPEGYSMDIIAISEADSMAEAYNAAMDSSDAKYKIYMHQDVFIQNKNFIGDLLKIFQSDRNVGLVGVIGGVLLPNDAIVWNAWNMGYTYACTYKRAFPIEKYQDKDSSFLLAEAVDGMLMATQYDIRWREDLNLGWDFYDISQSLEFRRRGYQVAIPYQENAWCLHDCGFSNLYSYDKSREKILKEYQDFFSAPYVKKYDTEIWELNKKLFLYLKKLLDEGQFTKAYKTMKEFPYSAVENNNLIQTYNLITLYYNEQNLVSENVFFNNTHTWEQMMQKYNETKMLLRRLEADIFDDVEKVEYVRILRDSCLSEIAIKEIMKHNIYDEKKVYKYLHNDRMNRDSHDRKGINIMPPYKLKFVVIAHNQMELLKLHLETIKLFAQCSEKDIIIVDNHSDDGLGEWLCAQTELDYVLCDEKVEGYGTILNTVIQEFVEDEDILIMTPQLMYLPGCKEKLLNLLYSNEHVGAVKGKRISSYEEEFRDFTSVLEYVDKVNENGKEESIISLPSSGVLIKNEMLKTLENFDETMMLPESTFLDFSFRGICGGYDFYELQDYCFYDISDNQDIYIEQFGSGADHERLKEKWNMNYFTDTPNVPLLSMIDKESSEVFHVLEIGCDCGVNLLYLKNKYPNATLYGAEINESSARIASHIAGVQIANIEERNLQFGDVVFDYIIFGDVLEHLRDPQKTLEYCRMLLKDNGKILASIPNIMHHSVMRSLLDGNFTYTDTGLLDKTHIHLFTYNEITRLFNETGFTIEDIGFVNNASITKEEAEFIQQLVSLSRGAQEFMYCAFQYLVLAYKS